MIHMTCSVRNNLFFNDFDHDLIVYHIIEESVLLSIYKILKCYRHTQYIYYKNSECLDHITYISAFSALHSVVYMRICLLTRI